MTTVTHNGERRKKKLPKKDISFGEKLAKEYMKFLLELDFYENEPYRNHHNFWQRDESFEAFMHWLRFNYFK